MTKQRFLTGVGRLVQGSVDEPQTKDMQGNLRVVKTGPNAGQPNPQFFIGVAFAKTDPGWPTFWADLVNAAYLGFPALFPHGVQALIDAQGPQPWFTQAPAGHAQAWVMHPQFSFKVIDGDSPMLNQAGRAWNTIEGFPGHWVVRFGSAYPPRCFHAGRYAAHEQIQEKGVIKRGYYVRVSGTVEGNANVQKPGLYINLDMVELTAYGTEITSGPDAAATFAAAPPPALPPGASSTPLTPPAGGPQPPAPSVVAGPQRPTDPTHIHAAGTPDEQWWINGAWMKAPAAPLPVPAVPAAPPLPAAGSSAPANPPVPPYDGYMAPPPGAPGPTPASATPTLPPATPAPVAAPTPPNPAGSPPVTPSATTAYPSSPPAPGRTMLPAAGGATYEQMIAAGWTDETLRQHGMMV